MKNNRLFGILYLLLSNNTITAKELSEYFEVSTRTIYRDIEVLSEFHIPIYMSKGKNGGIHLLENYKFDKALLTEEEQNQILFSLQGMNKLHVMNNDTYEKMKHLFTKTEEDWFDVDFSIWSNSKTHQESFEMIKKAIIYKSVITFSYFSSYGTCTKRKVEPIKLCFKYNSWYLCGFDVDKNDYRFFKIMRIKELMILEETFDRTIDMKIELHDAPPKMITLILQIDKTLAYRVYDEFEETAIQKKENGDFLVSVEFPYNDWIYGYILSFGEHIKVLEPKEVKKEIIERLRKSLEQYS